MAILDRREGGNNDGLYDCMIRGRVGRLVHVYLPVEQQV